MSATYEWLRDQNDSTLGHFLAKVQKLAELLCTRLAEELPAPGTYSVFCEDVTSHDTSTTGIRIIYREGGIELGVLIHTTGTHKLAIVLALGREEGPFPKGRTETLAEIARTLSEHADLLDFSLP